MVLCGLLSGGTSVCSPSQASTNAVTANLRADAVTNSQCGSPARIKIANPKANSSENPQSPTTPNDATPCQQSAAHPVSPQAVQSNQPVKQIFLMNNRVDVVVPHHKLILAEESEIPLAIHAQGLVTVNVSQVQYHGNDGQGPDPAEGSQMKLPILYHADGSAYVRIIPMRLGQVELDLSGVFPDGGIFHKRVMLDVDPPERKPLKLVVGQGGSPQSHSPMIYMHLAGDDRNSVNVYALYDNVKDLIKVDPAFVRFMVRTRDNVPIIHLNESTGIITPVNVGQALVETWFGGKKNLTCVEVTQKSNDWYDHSRCKDLLASGEELPRLQ